MRARDTSGQPTVMPAEPIQTATQLRGQGKSLDHIAKGPRGRPRRSTHSDVDNIVAYAEPA